MRRILFTIVAAAGLGLGGCATTPYADGMRYDDGSYYAPAREGYGDYYVAPEPVQPGWNDPFYDPFYDPFFSPFYYDPFWAGPGWGGGYCSVRYRVCPSWGWSLGGYYEPWFGYGGGRYEPWRHASWPAGAPRHRRAPQPAPLGAGMPVPSDARQAMAWQNRDTEAGATSDAGQAAHDRPMPRFYRRVPDAPAPRASASWPAPRWIERSERNAPAASGMEGRRSERGERRRDASDAGDGGGRARRVRGAADEG
jgi:hypothetical protein